MRRVAIAIILLLISIAAVAEKSNPAFITSMRVFPGAEKTVIYFQLTRKAVGTIRFNPSINRLIVKFENTKLNFAVKNARFKNANILGFSSRELIGEGSEFDFDTTGNVEWKTDYEVEMDASGAKMRLEINSTNKTVPAFPGIKSNSESDKIVEKQILHELAKYKDNLKKLKMERQELIGRARLEKNQMHAATASMHVFTVIIDPGHGGKDTGAIGKSGLREKDVVLSISKKLAAELAKIPGIRVVLTRKGDYYLPLRARLHAARQDDADLFIAVHADAYFNNNAMGASVYALSQHGATSEASRWLIQQEKYSELDGIDFDDLSDKSRMVRSVLIDLSQTTTIRDSLRLGNKVLDALDRVSALHHGQVEQAPFVVLKSPDIPSILVETGFITNPTEEARLMNPFYQDKIAHAIAHGVQTYIRKYGNR
ncbi:MAG TPA: N-acetylmuramoyl-L-alanine amidase [Gammaproteobacteria bacterium]|jgi:N-acetylmuramoyl-L-alanine amidase|nr:N-acetylmuramoyl-L-alanine amidase [Gammaproteobacteria bacterium]